MKRFLAMTLCALMLFAMIAAVSATDYVWTYDFEDDEEGDWIPIDNSYTAVPKQFSIQVVKFDGTMCMKYERTEYIDGAGDADCFSDLFTGGAIGVWGAEPKFILSYDIYFEKVGTGESKSQWQMGMLRMTPAGAGTQFQQSAQVIGDQIVPAGSSEGVYTIECGKWYNFAMAYDMENKVMSVYVNGDIVAEDIDWTVADTSANDAERVRIAWTSSTGDKTGEGIAYVDNLKMYNAEKPENATGKKAGVVETTVATPATEAPVTTAAPAPTTTAAPATQAAPTTTTTPAKTADAAVVIALVVAAAGAGAVVLKKRH